MPGRRSSQIFSLFTAENGLECVQVKTSVTVNSVEVGGDRLKLALSDGSKEQVARVVLAIYMIPAWY